MIGISLPINHFPHISEMLPHLLAHGVGHIELQNVSPATSSDEFLEIAERIQNERFELSVCMDSFDEEASVEEILHPLSKWMDATEQNKILVILPPMDGNVSVLCRLAAYVQESAYPVTFALDYAGSAAEEETSAMLALLEQAGDPHVGICWDMRCVEKTQEWGSPQRSFLKHVVHMRVTDTRTPITSLLSSDLCYNYFGSYNVSLFAGTDDLANMDENVIIAAVEALKKAMPSCARLYEEVRREFDARFQHALTVWDQPEEGTFFALIQSTSYLFRTNGFNWAMDVAFRNAYRLASSPHKIVELFLPLRLMIITHSHSDHFEERTVRLLSGLNMDWIIPDFLVDTAKSWGLREERIIPAHAGERITIGSLTVLPFLGRHFRPVSGKGVMEYGYHISAAGCPSLVFPADTRDFSLHDWPDLPDADYCFAHVWLGDKNSFSKDYSTQLETFVPFVLRFSPRHVICTHLYEINRRDEDMWRREHAEILSREICRVRPEIGTSIPRSGDVMHLT